MIKAFVVCVVCLVFLVSSASVSWSYSVSDLVTDVANDTKKALGKGLKAAYFYDAMERNYLDRNKVGVSAPLLAYKPITVEAAFIYTPRSSSEVGEFGFSFPIRITEIPLNKYGFTIGDYLLKTYQNQVESKSWIDRLFFGPFFSHNFVTGKFGAGVTTGVRF